MRFRVMPKSHRGLEVCICPKHDTPDTDKFKLLANRMRNWSTEAPVGSATSGISVKEKEESAHELNTDVVVIAAIDHLVMKALNLIPQMTKVTIVYETRLGCWREDLDRAAQHITSMS